MFKVSDKVVCVDDRRVHFQNVAPDGYVQKGRVYVVRGHSPVPGGIQVVGLRIIDSLSGEELGFVNERFRKLEEVREENRKAQQEPVA